MTYTLSFSLALGGSKAGLTMAAQLVNTSGGNVGSEVTSGFTEIGEGYYLWNYASIPDNHRGGVKLYENGIPGTILAFAALNPEEAEFTNASIQADAIWAYTTRTLTQAAASIMATVNGSAISIMRGDTLSISLTGLGSLSGYVSIDFTIKKKKSSSDNDAILRIRKNLSGSNDGLLRINGEEASEATNASLTIDDIDDGDITIVLAAAESKTLVSQVDLYYDIQKITATAVSTLSEGYCDVNADVTRAVV